MGRHILCENYPTTFPLPGFLLENTVIETGGWEAAGSIIAPQTRALNLPSGWVRLMVRFLPDNNFHSVTSENPDSSDLPAKSLSRLLAVLGFLAATAVGVM